MDPIKPLENLSVKDGDILLIETTDKSIMNMDGQWLDTFKKHFEGKRVLLVFTSPSYPTDISALSEETMNQHGWYRKK